MTTEEKRQALHEYCRKYDDCAICPQGIDGYCQHHNLTHAQPEIIDLWYQSVFGAPKPTIPTIKDSGARTEFESGAVRDIQVGKGRCDLMPLDVVADIMDDVLVMQWIGDFITCGNPRCLKMALEGFRMKHDWCVPTMLMEVAKHFEDGAQKYGENNWQKGIPVRCYIDSAIRHYLKWLRGDTDEPHDRAFCWNIMCAIWTCKHKPELNTYAQTTCPVCGETVPNGDTTCSKCQIAVKGGEQ